jgi:hypothetical protein
VGGTGSTSANYSHEPSGGGALGSSADVTATYATGSTGGSTVGGAGTVTGEYVVSASGGALVGSFASVRATYGTTSTGGCLVGGAGRTSVTYNHEPTGGCTVGGITTVTATYNHEPSGGAVLGSSAMVTAVYSLTTSGGCLVSGHVRFSLCLVVRVTTVPRFSSAVEIEPEMAGLVDGSCRYSCEVRAIKKNQTYNHVPSGGCYVGGIEPLGMGFLALPRFGGTVEIEPELAGLVEGAARYTCVAGALTRWSVLVDGEPRLGGSVTVCHAQ